MTIQESSMTCQTWTILLWQHLSSVDIDIQFLRHSKNIQNAIEYLPKWYYCCWTSDGIIWLFSWKYQQPGLIPITHQRFFWQLEDTWLYHKRHLWTKPWQAMSIYFWDKFLAFSTHLLIYALFAFNQYFIIRTFYLRLA